MVVVRFSSELMYEVSVASFRPATVPASFTTTTWVCELGCAVICCTNCTIVGIKAARNTMTRRIMLVMIKLRWVTRFLYSRPIIKRILRGVFWAAAPLELTATALCSCSERSCSGMSTSFFAMVSFFLSSSNEACARVRIPHTNAAAQLPSVRYADRKLAPLTCSDQSPLPLGWESRGSIGQRSRADQLHEDVGQ